MSDAVVELVGVTKRFGNVTAVNNVSLEVRRGEFLTLLGPSGCGKTTTLRLIAGFEQPTEGQILLNGRPMRGVPPFQRDVNTVFQSYALFPHMNVYDNVAFGLRMKKLPRQEIDERVRRALALVGLEGFERRRPRQLSGGQQQRVALARALVNNPQVLLLDEPLGALDLKLRKQMQVELKHLQKRLGTTFVYVTHDQEEALTMSDRIAVMQSGVVEQLGNAVEVYQRPQTRFVANFIGETNLLTGCVLAVEGERATVALDSLRLAVPATPGLAAGVEVHLSIRPEFINVLPAGGEQPGPDSNNLPGRVKEHVYIGFAVKVMVAVAGEIELVAHVSTARDLGDIGVGKEVTLAWDVSNSIVIKS
ncbi:MAG: ABC transporter ATP-binding protein [Bacillota bacterium]